MPGKPAGQPGLLPGPGWGSVAVQDLGLVLVPGGGGAVRVDDQGPAPAVDDHLVVERQSRTQSLTDVVAVSTSFGPTYYGQSSCRRGPCAWCGAPRRPRRAGCSRRPTGSAGPAAAPRCGVLTELTPGA